MWHGIRLNYCPCRQFRLFRDPLFRSRAGQLLGAICNPTLAPASFVIERVPTRRARSPAVPDVRPTLVINNFPFRRISRSLNRDIRSGASSIIMTACRSREVTRPRDRRRRCVNVLSWMLRSLLNRDIKSRTLL